MLVYDLHPSKKSNHLDQIVLNRKKGKIKIERNIQTSFLGIFFPDGRYQVHKYLSSFYVLKYQLTWIDIENYTLSFDFFPHMFKKIIHDCINILATHDH